MKHKRIISLVLTVAMMLSMCMTGFAVDTGEIGTPLIAETCTCTTKCVEGAVNADCPVCSADGVDLEACKGAEATPTELECICETKCAEGTVNTDCPVCSGDGADLTACKVVTNSIHSDQIRADLKSKLDQIGEDLDALLEKFQTEYGQFLPFENLKKNINSDNLGEYQNNWNAVRADIPVFIKDKIINYEDPEVSSPETIYGQLLEIANNEDYLPILEENNYENELVVQLEGYAETCEDISEHYIAYISEIDDFFSDGDALKLCDDKAYLENIGESIEDYQEKSKGLLADFPVDDLENLIGPETTQEYIKKWEPIQAELNKILDALSTIKNDLRGLSTDSILWDVRNQRIDDAQNLENQINDTIQKVSSTLEGTPVYYLDEFGNQRISGVVTVLNSDTTTWNGDWYVANGDVTINDQVKVSGNVHLILADGAHLITENGITVTEGNSLTIYVQSTGSDVGRLTANVRYYGRAAIGGDNEYGDTDCGTVIINGGIIKATADGRAAAIGGGGGYDGNAGKCAPNTVKMWNHHYQWW